MNLPIRVLVVDDLPRVRDALVTLLATFSEVEVVGVAADGREAVAEARKTHPDVVLMDLEMPQMDGLAATAAIVAEHLSAVVVLSIHSHALARAKAIAAGASAFVEKGAKPEVLLQALLDTAARQPEPPEDSFDSRARRRSAHPEPVVRQAHHERERQDSKYYN